MRFHKGGSHIQERSVIFSLECRKVVCGSKFHPGHWFIVLVLVAFVHAPVAAQSNPAFIYVLNNGRPTDSREVRIPPHLEEAVVEAERMLLEDEKGRGGALVYVVRTKDDAQADIQTQLRTISPGGGFKPGRASVGIPKIEKLHSGRALELRLSATNYEVFARKAIVRSGWIVIWDDIELQPLTGRSAATIYGRLWLEGESGDISDIVVSVDGEPAGFTDAEGYFVLERVSPGEVRVGAYRKNFVGLYTTVKVESGGEVECELRGHRQRAALVRWAYQPDGSRSFEGATPTGLAVLSPHGVRRVVFSSGLDDNVKGRSDFFLLQEGPELSIRNFDMRGPDRPTFVRVSQPFDRVVSAPEEMKRSQTTHLRVGDVFVFRCYEGDHSAKMEVLSITDDPDQIERWNSEVARYRESSR